jgi:hypothetical protein
MTFFFYAYESTTFKNSAVHTTKAQDGDEWSASRPAFFTPWIEPSVPTV